MCALISQSPLQSKIAFRSRLRVGRDHRHEQSAVLNLPADFRVPLVADHQLIQIKPYLHAGRAKGLANTLCGLGILRCVTEKYGFGWTAQSTFTGAAIDVLLTRRSGWTETLLD